MSLLKLFFTRLKKGWHQQYKAWNSAADWTVWLYILLPLLAIFFYKYLTLFEGETEWAQLVPLQIYWFLLLIVSWTGTIRLFLEEGDLLFIRQNVQWLLGLMKLGIIYSIIKNLFFVSIVFSLIFPLLTIYHHTSYSSLIIYFIFINLSRLTVQFVKHWLSVTYQSWKLLIMNVAFFIVTLGTFSLFFYNVILVKVVIIMIILLALVRLIRIRMRMRWCFFEDCIREEQERIKFTGVLVGAAGIKTEKRFFKRYKPLILFRNSMQLFRKRTTENLIFELFLKILFRNRTKLVLTIQLTGGFVYALSISPIILKWILLPLCMFSLILLVKTNWRDFSSHSFFMLYRVAHLDIVTYAVKKAICFVTLPLCFIFGFTVGVSIFSLLVSFIIALASTLLAYLFVIILLRIG